MIQTIEIDFAKQSYTSKSKPFSSERLINMYAESGTENTRSPVALFSVPGLTNVVDVDVGLPCYGLKKMGEFLYAVIGSGVYQIDSAFTATLKGTLPVSPGRVKLSQNGYQLTILTAGGGSWIYDATGDTFAQITDVDYQLASDVIFLDSYTIFSKQNSQQYFWSSLNDSSAFDALDFASAEDEPDGIVGLIKFQGEMWIFGQSTIEVHQNTGGEPPFQRINGVRIQRGCAARDTIASIDSFLFWLGDDNVVYIAKGYGYDKVSTDPIDAELQTYTTSDIEQAQAFTYYFEGHKFYVLNFPTKQTSFEYDIMTGLWHERQSYDSTSISTISWRGNNFEFFGGKYLVGDANNGVIYELDGNVFTEGEETLFADMVSSPLFHLKKSITVCSFRLDSENGVGITSGQGSDPEAILQVSRDGGRTYGNEFFRKLGKIGEYRVNPTTWHNIGSSKQGYTFRVRISDPVKRVVYGAYVNYEEGSE